MTIRLRSNKPADFFVLSWLNLVDETIMLAYAPDGFDYDVERAKVAAHYDVDPRELMLLPSRTILTREAQWAVR